MSEPPSKSVPGPDPAGPAPAPPAPAARPAAPARPDPVAGAPRRVLVTGGCGFIGSHLADRLLARGDHVTVVDDLSTGRRDNLPADHPRLTVVVARLSDYLAAAQAARAWDDQPAPAFDEIYHLAAAVGVKLIMDEPVRAIETNVHETAALLRHAAEHATPTLVASSSEVYGKSERVPFREDDDVTYGPTTKGRWSYAASKAIDEYLALAYAQRHGLPVVVARFFNTVGPRQVGDYGMVLPRFVAAAMAGEDLLVHGDGGQSRCFCDVRDVAEALPRMLEAPACFGRVFNVGSDRLIAIGELAELVIASLGSGRIRRVPYDAVYAAGFEDLRVRQPDVSRLRQAIGFTPSRPLEVTIGDVAAWLRTRRPSLHHAATPTPTPTPTPAPTPAREHPGPVPSATATATTTAPAPLHGPQRMSSTESNA